MTVFIESMINFLIINQSVVRFSGGCKLNKKRKFSKKELCTEQVVRELVTYSRTLTPR